MTDPLSLVFIVCFLVGLVFFIATALLGNLGHGIADGASHHINLHVGHQAGVHTGGMHTVTHGAAHTTGHAPGHTTNTHAASRADSQGHEQSLLTYLNPTSIMLFLLGFGFFGYLFHNIVGLVVPLFTLALAGGGGVFIAAAILLLLNRLFGDSEGATVQDVSDRTGLLGKVSIPVQENGIGEIIYISPGGLRKSIPARSIDGRRLERDQEVVVVNYQRGIAEVDTWDHFINEEENYPASTRSPDSDELATLRTLLEDPSKSDSQLIMRKDPQKE